MKTVYGFLLMLFISGCSMDFKEEKSNDSQTTEVDQTEDMSEVEGRDDASGCGLYGPVVRSGPDGTTFVIPVECNPYYFDKGDPDPTLTEESEEVSRPHDQIPITQKVANES